MKEVGIYLIAFIMTLITAFFGERKTKVDVARDNKEFNGRMIVIILALILFITFEVIIRYFLNKAV
jgi:hypothetical protein